MRTGGLVGAVHGTTHEPGRLGSAIIFVTIAYFFCRVVDLIDLFGKHIQQQVLPGGAGHIYNLMPYSYTADEIFDHMQKYFK